MRTSSAESSGDRRAHDLRESGFAPGPIASSLTRAPGRRRLPLGVSRLLRPTTLAERCSLDPYRERRSRNARAQDVETPTGAWVHAYLHRKEGDIGNAGYWYRQAGRPVASGALDAEWEAIAAALLG